MVTARQAAVVILWTGLAIAVTPAWHGDDGQAALPQDVAWILRDRAQFPAEQLAAVARGEVIARTEVSPSDLEAWAVAAVRISTPKPRAVDYFHQLLSYEDGEVTLQFGTVSNPPRAADFSRLTLDPDDIDDLRSCRPGRCDVRLGPTTARTIGSAIDWRAPDAADRVHAWAREQLTAYVTAYLARGDDALIAYDDQSQPVKLRDMWRGILANSPSLTAYAPALVSYLTEFPRGKLAGLTEQIYWDKERLTGLKPIVFVTHMTRWTDPARPDRTIVAQKQIYASHYFYGSLAVTGFFEDTASPQPATYVVYYNRSRGDLLQGGFGGLQRRIAERAARDSAEQLLGGMKRALEQAAGDAVHF
jgi:hypothetical protein